MTTAPNKEYQRPSGHEQSQTIEAISFGILALLDKGDSYDYLCPSLGYEQCLPLT